jgi:hypothetical protein
LQQSAQLGIASFSYSAILPKDPSSGGGSGAAAGDVIGAFMKGLGVATSILVIL